MKKEVIVIYIIIALIAMFFISKILKRLGILKSQEKIDREKDVKELRQAEFFSPLFYKNKTFKPMSNNELEKIAKDVRKAVRFVGTNEELLYSSFKKLYNKLNISQLAEIYYSLYQKDLQTDIMKDLNDKEKSTLMNIIKQLPDNT